MNGNGSLTASDILALTKDGNSFNGVGGFILLFIFLIALMGGNGFGWGNNNANAVTNALGQSDLQNSLYFQSQDNAIRNLGNGQASIIDQVMTSNYNNALLLKDVSNQISNSVAGISNQIANQTNAMQNMFNQQTIDMLRDKLSTTRDSLNNQVQTQTLSNAIQNSTDTILNSQGRYVLNPPCYTSCGCGSNLY